MTPGLREASTAALGRGDIRSWLTFQNALRRYDETRYAEPQAESSGPGSQHTLFDPRYGPFDRGYDEPAEQMSAEERADWQQAIDLVDRWNHYDLMTAIDDPARYSEMRTARRDAYIDVYDALQSEAGPMAGLATAQLQGAERGVDMWFGVRGGARDTAQNTVQNCEQPPATSPKPCSPCPPARSRAASRSPRPPLSPDSAPQSSNRHGRTG